MESTLTLRRTAAALCSAAIHEIVPGSDLLGGGETETGFFYQFFYPKALTSELQALLEEKMRQIIREDRPVRQMEMVAFSAKEMFQKAYHMAAIDALEECEPKELVSVVRIGAFADLAEGPFSQGLFEVKAFQLTRILPLGDGEYRVEGCVAESKDELKAALRELRRYEEENHLVVGAELNLWERSEVGILWRSKGIALRKGLARLFREKIAEAAELVSAKNQAMIERFGERLASRQGKCALWLEELGSGGDPEGGLGLFEDCAQSLVEQRIYFHKRDFAPTIFSLLQSIHKTLIILGFHPEVCLRGRTSSEKSLKLLEKGLDEAGVKARFEADEKSAPRAQWIARDGLGLQRIAVELKVEAVLSVKLSVERILGLLLEQTLGNLPESVIPEH